MVIDNKLTEMLHNIELSEKILDSFDSENESLLLESTEYVKSLKLYSKNYDAAYNYIKENYPEITHENITNIITGHMSLNEALNN